MSDESNYADDHDKYRIMLSMATFVMGLSFGIFFIFNSAMRANEPESAISDGIVTHAVPDAMLMLVWGVGMLISGWAHGATAWKLDQDDHYRFLETVFPHQFFLSTRSPTWWHWFARVTPFFFLPMGALMSLVGARSLIVAAL